jgi:hypothetical protein
MKFDLAGYLAWTWTWRGDKPSRISAQTQSWQTENLKKLLLTPDKIVQKYFRFLLVQVLFVLHGHNNRESKRYTKKSTVVYIATAFSAITSPFFTLRKICRLFRLPYVSAQKLRFFLKSFSCCFFKECFSL